MTVPFLRPDLPIWDTVKDELEEVYRAGAFHPGKYVERFEREVERVVGTKHAVMVSTASDGLILLMCYARENNPARRVVFGPDFTFRATPQAAVWAGLKYNPVDVGLDGNLYPEFLRCAMRNTNGAAVLGVHVFGLPCDREIERVALDRATPVFYDAAHALGAKYADGTPVGRGGLAECFSLNITKSVPSCGEGGVITTNDPHLYNWLRKARWHGDIPGSLDWVTPGMNAKPSEWQGVVAYHSMMRADGVLAWRNVVAKRYEHALFNGPQTGLLPLQSRIFGTGGLHSYKDYAVIACDETRRIEVCRKLDEERIGYKRYFSVPVSMMAWNADENYYTGSNTKALAERVICLPIYGRMTEDEQAHVIDALRRA